MGIYNDDVLAWSKDFSGKKFHALLCDPPYHLTTITKRFGKEDSKPAKYGTDGAFSRLSKGFMGQEWDGGDIAFQPETWYQLGLHLYPGAFGMAFSSSRTWHRLAVAIEDAGFVIHPSIFGWLYSSGFPKATRVDVRLEGELKETWEGHRYGMQALKPALEPIIVFQKPYEGRPLDNITETGAGALNIEAGRIPTEDNYVINRWTDTAHPFGNGAGNEYEGEIETRGRWPANFIVDDSTAELMGDNSKFFFRVEEQLLESDPIFYCSKASNKERDAGLEELPDILRVTHGEMKVDQSGDSHNTTGQKPAIGKNNHPTVKPIALAKYLAKLLLPPDAYAPRSILVPFSGSGSEMIGCFQAGWEDVVGIEQSEDYCYLASQRLDYYCNLTNVV